MISLNTSNMTILSSPKTQQLLPAQSFRRIISATTENLLLPILHLDFESCCLEIQIEEVTIWLTTNLAFICDEMFWGLYFCGCSSGVIVLLYTGYSMAICTHCLPFWDGDCLARCKGDPLYLTTQFVHVAFVFGLVSPTNHLSCWQDTVHRGMRRPAFQLRVLSHCHVLSSWHTRYCHLILVHTGGHCFMAFSVISFDPTEILSGQNRKNILHQIEAGKNMRQVVGHSGRIILECGSASLGVIITAGVYYIITLSFIDPSTVIPLQASLAQWLLNWTCTFTHHQWPGSLHGLVIYVHSSAHRKRGLHMMYEEKSRSITGRLVQSRTDFSHNLFHPASSKEDRRWAEKKDTHEVYNIWCYSTYQFKVWFGSVQVLMSLENQIKLCPFVELFMGGWWGLQSLQTTPFFLDQLQHHCLLKFFLFLLISKSSFHILIIYSLFFFVLALLVVFEPCVVAINHFLIDSEYSFFLSLTTKFLPACTLSI
ncbi:hypothetical protein VP01_1262g1 [Puccinia sorghi]|uniref:Uncharacterized protein n=1 Tax=Puccinia sorghi TaxID=27349 RepID=A0A0L6VP65_9BASI|nr:hypothetical protein VP01_1262g1 [Puccinia sorghi]